MVICKNIRPVIVYRKASNDILCRDHGCRAKSVFHLEELTSSIDPNERCYRTVFRSYLREGSIYSENGYREKCAV